MLTQWLEIKARGCCRHVFLVKVIKQFFIEIFAKRYSVYKDKLNCDTTLIAKYMYVLTYVCVCVTVSKIIKHIDTKNCRAYYNKSRTNRLNFGLIWINI